MRDYYYVITITTDYGPRLAYEPAKSLDDARRIIEDWYTSDPDKLTEDLANGNLLVVKGRNIPFLGEHLAGGVI